MARSPVSPSPCSRCSALRRSSRWLSSLTHDPVIAASGGGTPAVNTWSKAPNVERIPNKTLRIPRNPELVKPMMPYPTTRPNERSKSAVYKSAAAQISQENHLKSKRLKVPSWKDTLQVLESRTPKRTHGWKKDALKIVIPAEFVKEFTTNLDNNIWDIHDRTSAEVNFYKGTEGDGRSAILLSGDDVAVRDAAEIIKGVCEDAQLVLPDPSNPGAPLLRGDPEMAKEICIPSKVTHQPRILMKVRKSAFIWNHRLEDIPKPQVWDQFSFMSYIRTLSLVKLRPHRAIEFYGTPQAAIEVKMVLIHEAFRDRSAADALTVTAFKMALECMEEKGLAFRAHARRLFTQLQIRRLPFDIDVFNKFLFGSARARDLPGFNNMLDFMADYDCHPNYKTWRLFLQMVPDEQAKRTVVRAMDRIGLLHNPHAVSDIVRELAGFDMHRAVEAGKDAKTFCREMDAAYGPTWPSVTALNRLLHVCGNFARPDMCEELLDHFREEYRRLPDLKTFVTLTSAMRATNNFPGALSVLRRLEKQEWSHKTYHLYRDIFTLAWHRRLPNVMAVIWAYACLDEATSFGMRFRVGSHLSRPGYRMSPGFGGPDTEEVYRTFAAPGYVPVQLRAALTEELLEHPEQERHLGAVVAKLFRVVWSGSRPTVPLSELIDKAWEVDKKLIAKRQALGDKPGSHVVSIKGELPATAAPGGGEPVMEIPIRWAKEGGGEEVVSLPLTTEAIVHNYDEAWYKDVASHPLMRYEPGRCEILPRGQGVSSEDVVGEKER
ncbi:uncharacterized protein DNG_00846 [Cephalotrichum gorgonifer]|uniref:Pentatricopeptide repeat domain-containing protein n=1 Tax=Cephalotrichum gorgonifer TaxID=2041049 RepID=A0AAE8SR61_9PEZI|nr:uncharacterized protein DNG_00846 [Cephalotrichum gorgonifer]